MTLTKVALTVAAAAVATNFILKGRRGPEFADTEPGAVDLNEALDGAYGTDGTDAAADADASTAPAAVSAMAMSNGPDGASDSADPLGAGESRPAAGLSDPSAGSSGVAGAGAESPNDAERLAANGLGTAPQAGIDDDPLKSTSQETADARAPGLPDFFRGA